MNAGDDQQIIQAIHSPRQLAEWSAIHRSEVLQQVEFWLSWLEET